MIRPEVNRPQRAGNREPEAGLLEPRVANAGEVADRPVGHAEHRRDRIAGDQPDALRALRGIRPRDRPAAHRSCRLAPLRFTTEVGHHVKQMAAEHPEILAATTLVFLAAAANLEHLPDPAVLDQIPGGGVGRRVTVHEREREFRIGLRAGRQHRIGLGERANEGLLHEDAPGPRLGGRDRHLGMAVDVPHADGDDVGFDLGEHTPPVAMHHAGL